jgi:predicted permease
MSRLAASYPATNRKRGTVVKATSDVHFHPSLDPQILPLVRGLMLVVALVLVVACLNVAGMLLARASRRQREIGMRLAIGASRWRLVRQLMTESMVLSLFGAIVGTLLAWWIVAIVGSLSLPTPIPLAFDLRIDVRVLGFTLAATAAAALLAGLVPGLQASKTGVAADLRGEQTGTRAAGLLFTLRDALVAAQMAATVILLVGAALLTRSLVAEERAGLGFPVSRLALVAVDASQVGYTRDNSAPFFEALLARVRTIPGVEAAAITSRPVFSLNSNRWDIWVPDRYQPGRPTDTVELTAVSPDYFKTMDVPILAGRNFTDADGPGTPRVAIVNETMARKLWPGTNAIGQTFRSRSEDGPVFQVVGISADHKVMTVAEPLTPFLHVPRRQQPNVYGVVIARTRGDAGALLRDMDREIHALGPALAFFESRTMEGEVGATLLPVRASAWVVGSVGAVAMLLAAVGLYGVIAYSVARRTREIGIRMALGARQSTVLGLIMRHGLFVALAGLAAGSLLAAIAVRQIAPVLYRIGPGDPVSWLATALTILVVSVLANLLPAWRAARVHPSESLRIE